MHCCQIKSHFFLIPFLICFLAGRQPGASPLGESLSIIPHLSTLCQAFLQNFFNFFCFFSPALSYGRLSLRQLAYITTSFLLLSTLFSLFFRLFLLFSLFRLFSPPPPLFLLLIYPSFSICNSFRSAFADSDFPLFSVPLFLLYLSSRSVRKKNFLSRLFVRARRKLLREHFFLDFSAGCMLQ